MVDYKNARNYLFDVLGAIFNAHSAMGPGLSEVCY